MDIIKNSMRYTDTHIYFFTDEAPFSNFYRTNFKYKGFPIFCSEQAFMLEKANLFNDEETFNEILKAKTPYEAKKLGRKVKNYNDNVWNFYRFQKMQLALYEKFSQNENLKAILLETDDKILVEGSPFDSIWVVKLDWKSQDILDESKWKGQNLLGEALMVVRKRLKEEINK